MAATFRRVILKPADLSQEQAAQLAEKLTAAIEAQKMVAATSPHVLQYVGGLQENSDSFIIEHEPAEPVPLPDLYNSEVPGVSRPALWRITIAVLDALRAAHAVQGKRPVVHGAICPGVLVRDHNGVEKLTDFGFGQAFCDVISEQAYINLAVQAEGAASLHEGASGIWEVLPAYESGRDDRICAFIDPEKYGSQLYRSFERGADMASAGILFYLLSEHRHPYFYNEPDAVRSPELAEAMAYGSPVPFNTLREELRDSDEPEVKIWRELLWEMIDRVPQGRPSAADTVKRLISVGIQPVEEQDVSTRRLETLTQRLAEADCVELSRGAIAGDFTRLAETPDVSAELADTAKALGQVAGSLQGLAGEGWSEVAKAFLQRPVPAGLPAGAQSAVENLRRRISSSIEIQQALERIEALLAQGSLRPDQADAAIKSFQAEAQRLKQVHQPPPGLKTFADRLWRVLARRRAEADPAIEEIRTQADAWLAELDELAAAEQWDRMEEQLSRRAELPAWLLDLDDRVERFQQVLRWQRLKFQERSRLRDELRQQIQQASQLLGNRDLAGAKALLEPVMQQTTLPDLADQARTLYTRAAEQEAAIQAQHEKEQQVRRRAEGLLETVETTLEQPLRLLDETSISRAEAVIAEVMDISELPEAMRARAREAGQKAERLREELIRLADENIRQLERQEQDLAKATTEFEQGHLVKARLSAELLMRSEFANLVEAAQELLTRIDAALREARDVLSGRLDEAEQAVAGEQWDQAILGARQVLEAEAADLALRERAEQIIRQAEAIRVTATEARENARSTYEQALASFEAADLVATRRLTDELLGNPHAEPALLDAVRQLEAMLAKLEASQALADQGRFPEALRNLDMLIEQSEPGHRILEPATLQRHRTKNRQAEVLVAGIRKHLRHRAEKEQAAGQTTEQGDSQTSVPDWLRARLHTIDYFMGDRALDVAPEPPGPLLAPGDQLGDKYEIIESLGRGGMAEVYRARDLDLDREVALKLTPDTSGTPELDKALENEAKAIARLRHPNIMHINSSGVLEGRRYFDTNYIQGQDLALYAREQRPTERNSAEILIAVAEALAYAHEHGVLHRDVKPQNIYVSREPGAGPWLIDFGLAYIRSLTDGRVRPGLCGTPGYIAPEVITSMGEQVDHRTDVFALGCVLYELLAGRPPFHELPGQTPKSMLSLAAVSQTLLNTLRGHYKTLDKAAPAVRPELARICEKAMAEEPQNRYQSASEMAAALASYLKTLDIEDSEADLKLVRTKFEERRRNTPEELNDLQEAAKLAESVRHHGISEMQSRAKDLSEEIKGTVRQITDRVAKARKDLRAAAEAHGNGDHQGAINGAQAVLATPYAVDLHAEARRIIEKAQESLQLLQQERQREQKTRQRRALNMTLMAFVVLGIAGAAVYWFTRPGPPAVPMATNTPKISTPVDSDPPPQVNNTNAQIPPTPPVTTSIAEQPPVVTPQVEPPPPPPPPPPAQPTSDIALSANVILEGGNDNADRTTITLALGKEAHEDVTAVLELSSGNAEHGRDYTLEGKNVSQGQEKTNWTVVIPKGQTQAEVHLTARNNDVHDDRRTVTVNVVSMHNAEKPRQPNQTIHIDDDDRAGLEVQCGAPLDTLSVDELQSISCQVNLKSQPVSPVKITFTPPGSEVKVDSPTLSFDATNWKVAQPVKVTAADDGLITGPRHTQVTVQCETHDEKYKALSMPSLSLTIQDKDSASVAFSQPLGEVHRDELATHQVPVALKTSGQSRLSTPITMEAYDTSDSTTLATLQFDAGSQEKQFSFPASFAPAKSAIALQLRLSESSSKQIRDKKMAITVDTIPYVLTLKSPVAPPPPTVDPTPSVQQVPLSSKLAEIAKASAQAARQQSGLSALAGYWEKAAGQPSMLAAAFRVDDSSSSLHMVLPWGWGLPRVAVDPNGSPEAIANAMIKHLQKPEVLSASLRGFLQAWEERVRLEQDLQSLGASKSLDANQAWDFLKRIAAVKWQSPALSAGGSMADWLQKLQAACYKERSAANYGLHVEPTRYIEYFWGPTSVHAIYWVTSHTQGAGTPAVRSAKYIRVAESASLQKLIADQFDGLKPREGTELGNQVLSPMMQDRDFIATDSQSRSFGVAIAPDGPLCFVSLPHVAFKGADPTIHACRYNPLEGPSKTPQRLNVPIGAFNALKELCKDPFAISVWTMVSLGPWPKPRDLERDIVPLWTPWWDALFGSHSDLSSKQLPTNDPKIIETLFVYGPNDGAILGKLKNSIVGGRATWHVKFGRPAGEVDGGFLNPRLDPALILLNSTSRFLVLVSNPNIAP